MKPIQEWKLSNKDDVIHHEKEPENVLSRWVLAIAILQ